MALPLTAKWTVEAKFAVLLRHSPSCLSLLVHLECWKILAFMKSPSTAFSWEAKLEEIQNYRYSNKPNFASEQKQEKLASQGGARGNRTIVEKMQHAAQICTLGLFRLAHKVFENLFGYTLGPVNVPAEVPCSVVIMFQPPLLQHALRSPAST